MVASAIEARFRRHRAEEVEDKIEGNYQKQKIMLYWPIPPGELHWSEAQPPREHPGAARQEDQRVRQTGAAQREYRHAEHRRPGDELDSGIARFPGETPAQRHRNRYRKCRAKQNAEGRHDPRL